MFDGSQLHDLSDFKRASYGRPTRCKGSPVLFSNVVARLQILAMRDETESARAEVDAVLKCPWWGLRVMAMRAIACWGKPADLAWLQDRAERPYQPDFDEKELMWWRVESRAARCGRDLPEGHFARWTRLFGVDLHPALITALPESDMRALVARMMREGEEWDRRRLAFSIIERPALPGRQAMLEQLAGGTDHAAEIARQAISDEHSSGRAPLTPAWFKAARNALRLPNSHIAHQFGTSLDTVLLWQSGKMPIPDRVADWLQVELQLRPLAEIEWDKLLTATGVPGIAAAVIRDGTLRRTVCAGVRCIRSQEPMDKDTVFEAASLSKPVFAHAVLQLVDEGCLTLDNPLSGYLPGYVPDDERAASITARHVLSHSAGLPNWRGPDTPLRTYFAPGERFSYSGEGFWYLQKVVEAITGERLHRLAERLVLAPFGMTRSSFVWEERFDANRAEPHDDFGLPALSWKPGEANAAWTLQTTAADYAQFLIHALDGTRLQSDARLWLRPQIPVRHRKPQDLVGTAEVETGIAWGLGWGLEATKGTFFHWGNNGAFRAYAVGSPELKDALVVFANGASGLALVPALMKAWMPGRRPSLDWLGYGRHDAPVRRLLRAACSRGIAAVWDEVQAAGLGDDDLRWMARGLAAAGREEDGRWLRDQAGAAVRPAGQP